MDFALGLVWSRYTPLLLVAALAAASATCGALVGAPVSSVAAALTELELAGRALTLAGGYAASSPVDPA